MSEFVPMSENVPLSKYVPLSEYLPMSSKPNSQKEGGPRLPLHASWTNIGLTHKSGQKVSQMFDGVYSEIGLTLD